MEAHLNAGEAEPPEAGEFLRSDAKIEPLVAGWYAWPHAMASLPFALNLRHRYLPMMRAFVADPAAHVAACREPALLGGPFIDLPESAVPDVEALADWTEDAAAELLGFADGYAALDRELLESAGGGCLDQWYGRLPAALAGLVEFLYDRHGRPRLRLLEEMVHRYGPSLRGLQGFHLTRVRDEQRTFFLSTPRLASSRGLVRPLPFDSPHIDRLARMRTSADSSSALARCLGVDPAHAEAFSGLFTRDPPVRRSIRVEGPGVRVRYFGHACALVQTEEVAVLVDPLLTSDPGEQSRLTLTDLPDAIDFVAISHTHADHLSIETLLQLRHKVGAVLIPRNNSGSPLDPSPRLLLASLGFGDVRTMDLFDEVAFPGGRIVSLPFPGEHADLDIYARHCLLVEAQGRRILFLVDSNAVDPGLYHRLARDLGDIDLMFLGMECHGAPLSWLYGPLLDPAPERRNDESRRLSGSDAERAWLVVEALQPAELFVYALGQEPWLRYLMGLEYSPGSIQLREVEKLLARCAAQGVRAARLEGCCEIWFL